METYDELKTAWLNGNKKDVVYEIKHNYGFYDIATDIEDDETISAEEKVEMLCSIMRIAF